MTPNSRHWKHQAEADNVNDSVVVHNQASAQTIHGSQYFGNVNVNVCPDSCMTGMDDGTANLRQDVLASLAFPGMLDRKDNIAEPHRDTCTWILDHEEYRSWSKLPRGLLWIKGKPGSGKSTMMSFLHRQIRRERATENEVHLDFFFTAPGSELQCSPSGMLRSLLNQLFRQCHSASTAAAASYQDKCSAYGRGPRRWEWQRSELESLFSNAIIATSQHSQITIFIDALDEAGKQAATYVASYIHALNDQVVAPDSGRELKLKFCVASRHHPVISKVKGSEIWMEEHNKDDIKSFIDVELDLDKRIFGCDRPELRDWRRLQLALSEQADGVFQWIRLILPMLSGALEEGLTFEEANGLLRSIPKDLEDVYVHILREVVDQKFVAKSSLLFQWVVLARRSLSATETMHALASGDGDLTTLDPSLALSRARNRINFLSGGLIELCKSDASPDGLTVQVIHLTVREFMMDKGLRLLSCLQQSHDPSSSFEAKVDHVGLLRGCHAALYWRCLTYLDAFGLEAERSGLPSSHSSLDDLDSRFPFVDYATRFVFDHAQRASSSRNVEGQGSSLSKELELLQRVRLVWIKNWQKLFPDDTVHASCSLSHIAANFGLKCLLEDLIYMGCQPNPKDNHGYTPFHLACSKGHLKVCESLFRTGVSVDVPSESVNPLLHLAAIGGHLEVVIWLLEQGVQIDRTGANGVSALHEAAQRGHCTIVAALLRHGADVNAWYGEYGTAVHAAAMLGSKEIVQMLIHAGADIQSSRDGLCTALQNAAGFGHRDVVQMLVDAGADLDLQSGSHGTALQHAVMSGHKDIVHTLVDAGADLNARSDDKGTPLQCAVRSGYTDIIQILMDAGADKSVGSDEHDDLFPFVTDSE